ncbi:MAG: hypothetical protein DI537_20300 [Stutzerimonas stutzeri]|nr:MAG: hypothetical protein DI537_20300 [Stutzerimonas stutzeri]
MTTISAKTILRSRNAAAPDKVLSTLLLRYPRCIHAEFMTHRVFSRNAASSRAIPVAKLIEDVLTDPFVPLHWGANQKGMKATEECDAAIQVGDSWFDDEHRSITITNSAAWLQARDAAVDMAKRFAEAGYHKQIVNRLLEPFAHVTVVVSSTEWSNFLAQRDHEDAEPHIAMLAREIRKCLDDESTIQNLSPGDWHLPFVTEDRGHMNNVALSVARCASTSYKTVDGFDMTLERAVVLHDKLVGAAPLHASPCEHVAQADSFSLTHLGSSNRSWDHVREHKNFVGFRQYRAMLPGECQ